MSSNEQKRFLCVSVHDVAPHTWPECEYLLQAIRGAAQIPVTLLVVPAYHHHRVSDATRYHSRLEHRLALGDELALHGYTHLDEGAEPDCSWNRYWRQVYTQGEGEFSALSCAEAKRRLCWGLEWFEQRKWPVHGFVAPAWLLSEGTLAALREFPFEYTTTFSRFHFLPERRALFAPSLVYSARNGWGRMLSRQANSICAGMLRTAPLVRLGLHPRDAHHPRTVRHFQGLIRQLAATREAVTKASFARNWCASSSYQDKLGWESA
jgi:uncharacterized protein